MKRRLALHHIGGLDRVVVAGGRVTSKAMTGFGLVARVGISVWRKGKRRSKYTDGLQDKCRRAL
jgi:hypothetical protein